MRVAFNYYLLKPFALNGLYKCSWCSALDTNVSDNKKVTALELLGHTVSKIVLYI